MVGIVDSGLNVFQARPVFLLSVNPFLDIHTWICHGKCLESAGFNLIFSCLVFALAHEDDVKIHRWQEKYDQIPEDTKDPGLMKAKKALKKKKPKRKTTQQYWSEEQFEKLHKDMLNRERDIKIKHGGIMSNYEIKVRPKQKDKEGKKKMGKSLLDFMYTKG